MTTALWGIAVLLFAGQSGGDLPVGAGVMQLVVYWLLALGCTGFWITFLRVGEELVHTDWHIAYELNPEAILILRRDRHLDRILARGLAADRPPDFWPAGTWKLFAWIGGAFWAVSAVATAALATHLVDLTSPQRGVFLTILLIPAVQCTAASVIGPGLTRMLELREAARRARRLLCELHEAPHARSAFAASSFGPDGGIEDTIETMPIHVRAHRDARARSGDLHLRIVDVDSRRGRQRLE